MVGAINAYCALLAEHTGYRALYLSGAGVANASYGLPDLCITRVTALPLLVDIDTGWGSAFNIARAIRDLTLAGATGIHIEDQVQAKRCGRRAEAMPLLEATFAASISPRVRAISSTSTPECRIFRSTPARPRPPLPCWRALIPTSRRTSSCCLNWTIRWEPPDHGIVLGARLAQRRSRWSSEAIRIQRRICS